MKIKEFAIDDRLNMIKINIQNHKIAIIGLYGPCEYIKINEESEKLITNKEIKKC